jgi:hypothetical protein
MLYVCNRPIYPSVLCLHISWFSFWHILPVNLCCIDFLVLCTAAILAAVWGVTWTSNNAEAKYLGQFHLFI